jgi:hypothetical protein
VIKDSLVSSLALAVTIWEYAWFLAVSLFQQLVLVLPVPLLLFQHRKILTDSINLADWGQF